MAHHTPVHQFHKQHHKHLVTPHHRQRILSPVELPHHLFYTYGSLLQHLICGITPQYSYNTIHYHKQGHAQIATCSWWQTRHPISNIYFKIIHASLPRSLLQFTSANSLSRRADTHRSHEQASAGTRMARLNNIAGIQHRLDRPTMPPCSSQATQSPSPHCLFAVLVRRRDTNAK